MRKQLGDRRPDSDGDTGNEAKQIGGDAAAAPLLSEPDAIFT